MKPILYLLTVLWAILMVSVLACNKPDVIFDNNLTVESRAFTSETINCETFKTIKWVCTPAANFLQKDFIQKTSGNLKLEVNSDFFCGGPYGFRILIFVNNKITARRSLVSFPSEILVPIPDDVQVSVQTYIERNSKQKDNCENVGSVTTKVFCQ